MQNKIKIILAICISLVACSDKKIGKLEEREPNIAELPDRFSDSTIFQSFLLDFNQDGRTDIAFAHYFLEGDSLFLFEKTESGLNLSLATFNFTEGGLFFVEHLKADPERTGFTLETVFNGSGALRQTYYFELNKTSWILKQTMTETAMMDENRSIEYCTIIQNLELSKQTDWTKLRDKNEAQPEECFVK